MTQKPSKPLGSEDISAVEFVKEMLKGDPTYGINFDRIQWDFEKKQYVIVEFLLCDEKQFPRGITPYTSHPNRYFDQNAQKFISLWRMAQDLNARLYLVNYSKKGTQFEDQVLAMTVKNVNEKEDPPVVTEDTKLKRSEFSDWFRDLNRKGSR